MLINFRPQARSSTGICVAWPAAQLPLIYFFSSDFVASAWGVEGLPVWVVTTKGAITVDIPRPRHLPLPTHENHWNPPRNGERSSWVVGRSESLLVGMSGDSVLADGWPSTSAESPRNPVTPLGDGLVTSRLADPSPGSRKEGAWAA